MFDLLFAQIAQKVALSDREKEDLQPFFTYKKLRKRQFLLQEGDICKQLAFVIKGAVKSYTIDEKGHEHISLLGWEGWWISDFRSFIYSEAAMLTIDAIEDTELLLITKPDYEEMMLKVPVMERYFRILYQNSLVTKDRRLISSNTYTAEEKYHELIESYPQILERMPQHLIASFLGLTPETFSRVKRKFLEN
jgi:CRP-like cAMP-binding protein